MDALLFLGSVSDEKADERDEIVETKEDGDKENVENESPNKETHLEKDIMEALGVDPIEKSAVSFNLHSDVQNCWKYWQANGISEEEKNKLLKKYPPMPGFEVPKMNPEIASILSENATTRDNHMFERRNLGTAALSAVGFVLDAVLNEDQGVDKPEFVGRINDIAKIIIQMNVSETESRKAAILPGIDKQTRGLLEKAPTDEFLFGKNLSERIKESQALEKVGKNLKGSASEKRPPFQNRRGNLNYKSLPPKRSTHGQAGSYRQQNQSRSKFYFKGSKQPFNQRETSNSRNQQKARSYQR